ncbi:CGI-121-domain-containing protein [Acaromyces ingoldii]|uniref:EKC/KEOPS complex subunit CGI121 n=1 Tax=Acaromyces ingoldii TaxID=215250 RepID=A0A316YTP3_9BASI|nr:CGI-121-domain-containing protein [Acaromyces ingoldii]PWN92940.1 CGI-121-domain-containing protein [Acaromyces ingoldii]
METLHLSHLPVELSAVHICHVRSLGNAASVLARLKAEGPAAFPLQFALLDASKVTSRTHLVVGIHQALLAASRGSAAMKTRSIHSEILWALSPSTNIADSFRLFGLSNSTQHLIVVHVAKPEEHGGPSASDVRQQVASTFEGIVGQADGISSGSGGDVDEQGGSEKDWKGIGKTYKIPPGTASPQDIDSLATSIVAIKSLT